MKHARILLALGLAGCSGGGAGAPEAVHPSLLLVEADVPALRARAAASPWRELAQAAEVFARDQEFDPDASAFEAFQRMTDLCGALALSQVLAPDPAHVAKLERTLAGWEDIFLGVAPSGSGVLVRWQQSAMVQSILALDVFHGALAAEARAALETMLDRIVRTWWRERAQDGTTSTPGLVALWGIYAGDEALAASATDLFRSRLFEELAPSGVFDSGSGYAWVRQGGDRTSKYALIDVLEFTGRDRTLYRDPRLIGLHEWMYRGAFTPARRNPTFGDTDPTREVEALLGYMQPYRAGRFSAQAGRNAAWLVRDVAPRPLLANYVLMDDTILAPEAPESTLWGDTATFWEDAETLDSLQAALWSPRTSGSHSHYDVNAVHFFAYGQNVLRNSGYCGAGVGIDATFDWDWVSATAFSNNTLTLGADDHRTREGGGLREGLTAPGFDFASAVAGPALANGTHVRHLWMVHGEGSVPGYFLVLDEFTSDSPGVAARIGWHPDSALASSEVAGEEYEWTLGAGTTSPVALTVYLATPASTVELLDGGLCAFDDQEYVGRYLAARYPSDASGAGRALTAFLPHTALHPLAARQRLVGPGFTGLQLDAAGGFVDVAVESDGDLERLVGTALFRARGLWFRRDVSRVTRYFLDRGRSFDADGSQTLGLASDAELSIHVRASEVHVTSEGATVTFRDPLLTGFVFANAAGRVLSAAPGSVEFELAPGTHAFDLNTGQVLP